VEFKIILHHNWKQKQSFCHLACAGRLPELGMTSIMTNLRNANDELSYASTMNGCSTGEILCNQKLVLVIT